MPKKVTAGSGQKAGEEQTESLSQTEFAKRLGCGTRQIRNLTAEGVLPRNEDGTYPWPAARHAYIKFKQDEKERRRGTDEDGKLDLIQEQAKKTRLQTEKLEREGAIDRGELFHIRDIERLVREPLEQVDSALKNAPARHAAELAARAGVRTAIAMKIIDDIVESIRADLRTARHQPADAAPAA